MKLSEYGRAFLKSNEGYGGEPELRAYEDSVGILTIGWGNTHIYGRDVQVDDTITLAEAEQLFSDTVANFESAVSEALPDAKQHEFDAFVSFAYNIGIHGFLYSTALKQYHQGNLHEAAQAMLMWDKAGGKYSRGLYQRRLREAHILEFGYAETLSPEEDPVEPDRAIEPNQLEGRLTLMSSRTTRAALASGTVGLTTILGSITTASNTAKNVASLDTNATLILLGMGLLVTLSGIAYMAFCRYDDFRKGKR